MIQLGLTDIAACLGIHPPEQNVIFTGISHDTRTLLPGNLFIAIKGERRDGHDLIIEAANRGAAAALISHPVSLPLLPCLQVPDTIQALGDIVAFWRQSFSLPVAAVTGSNGKTTVKNMLASIFRAATLPDTEAVLATSGNLNNTIGLPLTLAGLGPEHRYAVVEMGMNQFGEIARLSAIARPTLAVITNAASSHLSGVGGNIAGVAKAKGEIFTGLAANGTAILNADDPYYDYWRQLVGAAANLSFGLEKTADVTATYTGRPALECRTPNGILPLEIPLPGRHNVMNALAATAAALAAGISPTAIQQGIATVQSAKGRMEQHFLPNGVRLIDDTYNANPFSLRAAVAILATCPGEKILILGDMRELGPEEVALHTEAGKHIASTHIDRLITYGTLTEHTSRAFGKEAKHFSSHAELLFALRPLLKKGVTVLIKGSRSMEMDKIVTALLSAHSHSPT